MSAKQQPNPQDRRAAALRENLRRRKEQSRLRIAQSSRDEKVQAQKREDDKEETED